jgi:hypothetical protein
MVERHRVPLAALLPQPHPAVLRVDVLDLMLSAAPMTRQPDHRAIAQTGRANVCSQVTMGRGPRIEPAGLTGTTWPVTSQSKRRQIAAGRSLTRCGGLDRAGLDPGCDMHRLDRGDRQHAGVPP